MKLTNYILCKAYIFLVIFFLVPTPAQAVDEDGSLVFGFLPILSTQKLITRFKPLVDQLSAELGRPIRMETAPDYAAFLQRTRAKRYDILFTAPHFYYLANKESGYQVIVRVNGADLKAIIVATKASKITQLGELRGKRIATPDSLSLVTAIIRNHLHEAGLDPDKDVTLVATPNHNTALHTAYNGITEAAGLAVPPFKRADEETRNAMVVLATTVGTPHMPIAVSASLKSNLVEKITEVLVSLEKTEQGRVLFKHLSWPKGFIRATNEEYAPLEKLIKGMHLE